MCLKSDPIWIFPFIYLFSSFSKSKAFSAVGCNLCPWLFPRSPTASEGEGWCGFLTINTQRGERMAVWSLSWAGHGPFSAFGTCFLLPRTFINHAGQIMGKGPHMKHIWWSQPNSGAAEFSSTTQDWNQSLHGSVPKSKNKIIRALNCFGRVSKRCQQFGWPLYVPTIRSLGGHLGSLPWWGSQPDFFFLFSMYITMHAPPGSQVLTEEYAGFTTESLPTRHTSGWKELDMEIWKSINFQSCLKLALHKSFFTSCLWIFHSSESSVSILTW